MPDSRTEAARKALDAFMAVAEYAETGRVAQPGGFDDGPYTSPDMAGYYDHPGEPDALFNDAVDDWPETGAKTPDEAWDAWSDAYGGEVGTRREGHGDAVTVQLTGYDETAGEPVPLQLGIDAARGVHADRTSIAALGGDPAAAPTAGELVNLHSAGVPGETAERIRYAIDAAARAADPERSFDNAPPRDGRDDPAAERGLADQPSELADGLPETSAADALERWMLTAERMQADYDAAAGPEEDHWLDRDASWVPVDVEQHVEYHFSPDPDGNDALTVTMVVPGDRDDPDNPYTELTIGVNDHRGMHADAATIAALGGDPATVPTGPDSAPGLQNLQTAGVPTDARERLWQAMNTAVRTHPFIREEYNEVRDLPHHGVVDRTLTPLNQMRPPAAAAQPAPSAAGVPTHARGRETPAAALSR